MIGGVEAVVPIAQANRTIFSDKVRQFFRISEQENQRMYSETVRFSVENATILWRR